MMMHENGPLVWWPTKSGHKQWFINKGYQANDCKISIVLLIALQGLLQEFDGCAGNEIKIFAWLFSISSRSSVYHYDDVTWISCHSTVVYSSRGPTSKKRQNPRYWLLVKGMYRKQLNSPHKGPVSRIKLPFDDVIMIILTCLLLNPEYS